MIFNKNKQEENEILESGIRDLVDNMFLIAIGLRKDATISYVNNHFLRLTGYTKDEVLNKNWFDMFIPIKKIDTVKKTFEIIVAEKYKMRSENPVLSKSGSEIFVEWHNSPITDPVTNKVLGTISIGVDITGRIEIEKLLKTTEESSRLRAAQLEEQNKILNDTKKGMLNLLDDSRRLEEELQKEKKSVELKVIERTMELNQEKARLEAAINSFPSGFLVTDKKGQVIIKNNILCQIFEASHTTECSIDVMHDLLKASVDVKANYAVCYNEKKQILLKDVIYDKKILEIYMAPIFVSQLTDKIIGVIVLITDVTEEKIIERSKDEFFSIASHELRTPITAIRGNIELISKYYSEKIQDKNFTEMLDDMRDSSIRLIHLVNEFLNTSRLEQGKMVFNITSFNIADVLQNVISDMNGSAASKNIPLIFEPSYDFVPIVQADPDKTKEIVINLVGNALAYTDKGAITIKLDRENSNVKVSIIDTGKGIPIQNQKLLFRKFQQANTNIYTRDVANSTGLGLYISKLIVESMNGKIFLERSEENAGSTFVFTLPLASV
jgi:two-component system, OmpR family, phosphate regulon sensor histidine kinase PhoR